MSSTRFEVLVKKEITFGTAIYMINLHSKTSLNPEHLYRLKRATISKLILEGKAKKIGLQDCLTTSKFNHKSYVLVKVEDSYFFHIPITNEDFTLPHLGAQPPHLRNPKTKIPYNKAVRFLEKYVGFNIQRPQWALSTYLDSSEPFINSLTPSYSKQIKNE